MTKRLVIAALLAVIATGAVNPSIGDAGTLARGFVDDVWFDPPADGLSQQQWITKTAATGAKFVQVEVDWPSVEPSAPAGVDNPTSPDGPQFNFGFLDQRVEEFEGSGLQPVFLITDAPRWAEGPGGTAAEYATGGYKPNATALGDLVEAMAKRYSGSYPNPLDPGTNLPRVKYYQAWAEAELAVKLSPQWTKSHDKWVNTGASLYRGMLNAFYAGVKKGDPSDQVMTSGFAPYGESPGGPQLQERTHPVLFLENLLCLNQKLKKVCKTRTHFDILADDPYEVNSPTTHAVSPLDASAPDLGRMTRVERAALKAHTLLPGGHKPLWVTEFGYDSDPPNPDGVPMKTDARWLEQGFYVFWKQGVSTAFWYLVRDQPAYLQVDGKNVGTPYDYTYASGVYYRNGKPKTLLTAYRFPLVVMADGRHAQIWGISPVKGTVEVQREVKRRWKTVATFHCSAGAVFDRKTAKSAKGDYRAVVAHQTSLVWKY